MDSIVTTATGKTYQTDYFNPCPPVSRLNIRVLGTQIAEIASVFSDPEETNHITSGEMSADGYTRLIAIMPEGNAIRIVLGKELV